jgi:hypothetical protein
MDERNTRTLKVQLSQNVNNSEREKTEREKERENMNYTLYISTGIKFHLVKVWLQVSK